MIDKINKGVARAEGRTRRRRRASSFLRTRSGPGKSWRRYRIPRRTSMTGRRNLAWIPGNRRGRTQDQLQISTGKTLFTDSPAVHVRLGAVNGDGFNLAPSTTCWACCRRSIFYDGGMNTVRAVGGCEPTGGFRGSTGKSDAKLRTLGGRAASGVVRSTNFRQYLMKNGQTYFWTGFANGQTNHSYAVLDLANSKISYYQTTAWLGDGRGLWISRLRGRRCCGGLVV